MGGHVVKRGKKYSVVLELGRDENGKRKQKWVGGFSTAKEAKEALAQMLHELRHGIAPVDEKITTGDWLDRWVKDFCIHLSPYTKKYYREIVECAKVEIGHVPLHKLQVAHLQEMVRKWHEVGTGVGRGPLSPLTIKKMMVCISAALNKAVELELIRKNPAKLVSLPRVPKAEPKVLDEQQMALLLEKARGTDIFIPVLLASTTGMRRGEIVGLRWQDVDFGSNTIRVCQAAVQLGENIIFKEPKTGRARTITAPDSLMRELREHRKRQAEARLLMGNRWKEHGLVCTAEDGSPMKPDRISGNFNYFAKTNGFNLSFHDLRHTHASILLKRGVNPKVIQERLGHSDIGMTLNIYSHLIGNMQASAAIAIDEIVGGGTCREAQRATASDS